MGHAGLMQSFTLLSVNKKDLSVVHIFCYGTPEF